MTGGAVALGAAAPSLLAGCSSSPSGSAGSPTAGSKPGFGTGTPVRGGSLTVGTIAEIDGFYPPTNHWDTNGYIYANTVYDPLMAVAADGSIEPYLAQSITSNSTFDTWTMTLRPGIKFNDGSALTSAVVKANFVALSASPLTGVALKQVASVATPDPMTVVFMLTAPNPTFPAGLTTQVGYVVGQAMINQANSSTTATLIPVGTGPFIYSQWQPNDHFTATRNPNYWRSGLPHPRLDHLQAHSGHRPARVDPAVRRGRHDRVGQPSTITNFSGSGASGFQLVDSRTGVIGQPTFTYIMLNTVKPPTNDLSIRQALAKAMNQPDLQKIIGGTTGQPGERDLPAQLAVLLQDLLPRLRPERSHRPGQQVQGPARDADAQPPHHPRPPGHQGGPGHPADVAAGGIQRDPVRGGAGHHHRRLHLR